MNNISVHSIQSLQDYKPAANLLEDRKILITGAANGIGRALALACARLGANTILLDIDEKQLNSLDDQIESEKLPAATRVPLDYTKCDNNSFNELAQKLAAEFGRLDSLIHCAADLGALCPLQNYDDTNWHRVMQVNLNSAYLLTRACLNLLRQSENASIIFTTADVARQAKAYWGAYAVAGYAVEGMAQIWAKELSGDHPICVNTIDPGAVNTRLRSSAYPGEDTASLRSPEEVAILYIYLLENNLKNSAVDTINGQRLSAD